MDETDFKYIRFELGDIVKEKFWITAEPGRPLYGIIVHIERAGYKDVEWIDYGDDKLEIFWLRWRYVEIIPSCFVELVSTVDEINYEKEKQN